MEQSNINFNQNSARIYTGSAGGELYISTSSSKQAIQASNNRSQYFAEMAKKYRDEAKSLRDDTKYYAEQNTNVTVEFVNNIKAELLREIDTKQDEGDYALKTDLPTSVSELENDSQYVTNSEFITGLDSVLPEQESNFGKFLSTDGSELTWQTVVCNSLFDTKLFDKILSFEESKGWALQGTYVYKEALAGSRYGYPDFYNKVVEEFNEAIDTEEINGVTMKVHSNGHKFYDIADKERIDNYFDLIGLAWFYGVDTENERVFLPRNSYLTSHIENGNKSVSVYGDGKSLGWTNGVNYSGSVMFGAGAGMVNCDTGYYGADIQSTNGSIVSRLKGVVGVTPDPTKSGITGEVNLQNSQNGMYLYICVGNTTNYEGVTDVVNQGMEILEQVNQSLESRVNLDATNLNNAGKSLITSYAMPSDRTIDLELGATDTVYTAPADGWVVINKTSSGASQHLEIAALTGGIAFKTYSTANNQNIQLTIPVHKGVQFTVSYSLGGITHKFRFIYAQGSEGEV